jgi:hypothetical protein
MLKKILIALAASIGIFLIVVAMQPADFPRRADDQYRRASGRCVCAGKRLPQMGRVVAMGEA